MSFTNLRVVLTVLLLALGANADRPASAQVQTSGGAQQGAAAPRRSPVAPPPVAGSSTSLPTDFVIGAEDVIGVQFWREADMTGDHTVRPDGMITLPLLGDLRAAGLKPEQLAEQIKAAASKYLTDANVSVVVRTINSRKVFITGQVTTPGAYPLTGPRTVMQLIALAGGLTEYAKGNNITVVRDENGQTRSYKFNYRDVARGKGLEQNLQLRPGDTVVVP